MNSIYEDQELNLAPNFDGEEARRVNTYAWFHGTFDYNYKKEPLYGPKYGRKESLFEPFGGFYITLSLKKAINAARITREHYFRTYTSKKNIGLLYLIKVFPGCKYALDEDEFNWFEFIADRRKLQSRYSSDHLHSYIIKRELDKINDIVDEQNSMRIPFRDIANEIKPMIRYLTLKQARQALFIPLHQIIQEKRNNLEIPNIRLLNDKWEIEIEIEISLDNSDSKIVKYIKNLEYFK